MKRKHYFYIVTVSFICLIIFGISQTFYMREKAEQNFHKFNSENINGTLIQVYYKNKSTAFKLENGVEYIFILIPATIMITRYLSKMQVLVIK